MSKDDDRPLTTRERIAEVRAATDDLAQIKPDDDIVKQRKSAANAKCKKAKVKAKYRKVAADIADLADDQREGAIGELAIALESHGLPLVLPLPVDPQLDLFPDHDPAAETVTRAPREAAPMPAPSEPEDGFDDPDPGSAANLDDDSLDTAGWTYNAAEVRAAAEAVLAEPGGREELEGMLVEAQAKVAQLKPIDAGIQAGFAGLEATPPADLSPEDQQTWIEGHSIGAKDRDDALRARERRRAKEAGEPAEKPKRGRRGLMADEGGVAGHA